MSFPNMDPIFHNVFSLSKAKSFDLGNYPKGETRVVTFNKPGTVYVDCHLHPNMAATIVVTPNRWYSRVDAAGQFSLRDVPPGAYSVVAWHKAAGIVRKSIEVTAGRTPSVEFVVPITDEGPNLRAEKVICLFARARFLFCFVPFALLLTLSFWMIQRLVQTTVLEGLRSSLRENQLAIGRIRSKSDLQNSRFLKVVGENAALKAGAMQLLVFDSRGK